MQTIIQHDPSVARSIEKLKQAIATQTNIARLHGAVFSGDLDTVLKLVKTTPRESIELPLAGQTLLHTAVLGSMVFAKRDTGYFRIPFGNEDFLGSTGSWWEFFRDSCNMPVECLITRVLVNAGAQRSARNENGQTAHQMATQSLPLGVHLFRVWNATLDVNNPIFVRHANLREQSFICNSLIHIMTSFDGHMIYFLASLFLRADNRVILI